MRRLVLAGTAAAAARDVTGVTCPPIGGYDGPVADQGIDVDVAPGETIVVDVAVGTETLVFVCKFHRTAGMVGAVVPAA